MGGSDQVCLLCGIREPYGPIWWCGKQRHSAEELAQEVLRGPDPLDISAEDLISTLRAVFAIDIGSVDTVVPNYTVAGAVDYGYDYDSIAIGHFDRNGGYQLCRHHGRPLHPTGDCVRVRRVRSSVGGGLFGETVNIKHGKRIIDRDETTDCSVWSQDSWVSSCNLWTHVPCWAYLQEWLDCPLSSRIGRNGLPLHFASELYEIASTRHERRQSWQAWLPCIRYGGTLDAFDECNQYQDFILGPRRGVKHLRQALKEGLRDKSLIPAILKDCRFWIFVRPNLWPRAPQPGLYDPNPIYAVSNIASQPEAAVCRLPNEILPELLQYVQLADIFSLASTCKDLHTRVLDRSTLTSTVRNAMSNLSSSLRWILPIPSLREEWLAACEAMETWMPPSQPRPPTFSETEYPEDDETDEDYVPSECSEESDASDVTDMESSTMRDSDEEDGSAEESVTDDEDEGLNGNLTDVPVPAPPNPTTLPLPPLPIFEPTFPLLTFLRAYRDSDSMRSRRRRWELIKQWDVLFANYRRDGWERDEDMCLPGMTWALDAEGILCCQCVEDAA
ncbi:hypothetical protein FKP32DRAFT_1674580 [Trametes sanguinea]|nr:hypothetical protein FKP32DRAFT_1674580 [Trametes sanguinea]